MKVKNVYLVYPSGQTAYLEQLYELDNGKWILLGKEIAEHEAKKLINPTTF